MATVIFFTRTTKTTNPDKRINVRVRFRHGKKINLYAKAGLEIFPHYFSNETHAINKQARYKDKIRDKRYLDSLEAVILDAFKGLKTEPTSEWLNTVIDKYRFPDKYKAKPVTLFGFIEKFIADAPERIIPKTGRPVSNKTYSDYKKTFADLKEFASSKGFDFKDINKDFYKGFVSFFTSKKSERYPNGLTKNTIGKKIKVLKTFLNAATPEYLTSDQYKGFKVLTENSTSVYLSESELQKFFELDLSDRPHLGKVRDLFLVGCWTGLRFSDWNRVRPENIKNGLITLNQTKTGQSVVIPIHPVVNTILDKYEGNLPKPISNQKFNNYLKKVARLADFKEAITKQTTRAGKIDTSIKFKWEMITTHTARRSFATNAYKMGIPSITIMAITGHRTETSFLRYIKITQEEHAERMRDIWLSSGNHLKVAK